MSNRKKRRRTKLEGRVPKKRGQGTSGLYGTELDIEVLAVRISVTIVCVCVYCCSYQTSSNGVGERTTVEWAEFVMLIV
jgi:hypothetical protein